MGRGWGGGGELRRMGREDERPILHGLSGGRWVGAVARVRTKLWFPAPRAELGREEGGFGCSHRPGLTSALETTAQSEQDLLGWGGGRGTEYITWKQEGFEDRTSCRDSVRRGRESVGALGASRASGEASLGRSAGAAGVGGSVRRSGRTMTHQLQHGWFPEILVGQSH